MSEIEITEEEIQNEMNSWVRDGLLLSREKVISILTEQKERDLWTEDGHKIGKEGD